MRVGAQYQALVPDYDPGEYIWVNFSLKKEQGSRSGGSLELPFQEFFFHEFRLGNLERDVLILIQSASL